jgi:hypothetical protein
LAENACRKLAKLLDPVAPCKSVMSVLKLVCNALSAVLAVEVPVAELLVDAASVEVLAVPEREAIKLCTSLASRLPGLPQWPDDAAPTEFAADVESDVELAVPSVPD